MLVTRRDFADGLALITGHDRLIFDTETNGLRPHLGNRACGISVWTGQEEQPALYFPVRHASNRKDNLTKSQYQKLIRLLSGTPVLTGFNTKFDLRMLRPDGLIWSKAEDVMLAAHLCDENEPSFRLKELGTKYIDPKAAESESRLAELLVEHGYGKGDMWRLSAAEVEEYACQDVLLTEKLRSLYVTALQDWGLLEIWQEVNEYMIPIAEMEDRGLLLDVPLIEQYMAEATAKEEELLAELREAAGYNLNPKSNPQMQAFLGLPSTAAEVLEPLLGTNPAIDLVIQYRQWSKVNSSYYVPWLEKASEAGVLHPNLLLHGTISSRLSARDPNVQAVPRTRGDVYKVKDVVVARPGMLLANLDYSQAEIRLFAHYSQDPLLMDVFARDGDTHAEVAANIGLPRDYAKRINLGTIYGLGANGLSEKLRIPLEQATEYMNRYNEKHPNTRRLRNDTQRKAERLGYIRLWTGRVRHYNSSRAEPHKAMSNLIQGGVAEIIRVAITHIHRMIRDEMPDAAMLLQVHDSVLLEIPEGKRDEYLPKVKAVMEGVGNFTVPLKVDVEVGPRWGDMEKWSASPTS